MADDDDDEHESFKDSGVGIGEAKGKLDTFPASELNARIEERDREEAAMQSAIDDDGDQVDQDDDDVDLDEELDELDEVMAQ